MRWGETVDRENVIKALECRKSSDKRCGNPCEETGFCYYARAIRGIDGEIYLPYVCDKEQICKDALELLKEQQDIVRCKDCRWWHPDYKQQKGYCGQANGMTEKQPTWFCADGERRTDDA